MTRDEIINESVYNGFDALLRNKDISKAIEKTFTDLNEVFPTMNEREDIFLAIDNLYIELQKKDGMILC
jgi:hypothetical protein